MMVLLGNVGAYNVYGSRNLSHEWWEIDTTIMKSHGFHLKSDDLRLRSCCFSWSVAIKIIDDTRNQMVKCVNCKTYVFPGSKCPEGCADGFSEIFKTVSNQVAHSFALSADAREDGPF